MNEMGSRDNVAIFAVSFATITTIGVVGNKTASLSGGIDLSDPCYRKFSNCIVVNAQPYERRSTVSVEQCKQFCTESAAAAANGSPTGAYNGGAAAGGNGVGGNGGAYNGGGGGGGYNGGGVAPRVVYVCRAFVYDTHNQVCDLFAHTGNQPPARLLRFSGRDYYEPTLAAGCLSGTGPTDPNTTDGPGPIDPPGPGEDSCGDQVSRYLKLENFELVDNDDNVREGVGSEQACLDLCTSDQSCASAELQDGGRCVLSPEAAIPTGQGEIRDADGTTYYEKICVDQDAASRCVDPFVREPQMILVGFAETVVDADTFEDCLSNCINSQADFGFACRSGMFYFQEQELNCILNTETQETQPDLFIPEETDIVDYFETSCTARKLVNRFRSRSLRRLSSLRSRLRVSSLAVRSSVDSGIVSTLGNETDVSVHQLSKPGFGEWTQWSPCDTKIGRKTRYERCRQNSIKKCPTESEACEKKPQVDAVGAVSNSGVRRFGSFKTFARSGRRDALISRARLGRRSRGKTRAAVEEGCPVGECCPLKKSQSCRVGLRVDPETGKAALCSDACAYRSKKGEERK